MRFRTELLIIGICCLPVALIIVALLTLSRNTSRLNLNRKLSSLKFVSCDSRHYMAKACAYSRQHRLWRHAGVGEFREKNVGTRPWPSHLFHFLLFSDALQWVQQ